MELEKSRPRRTCLPWKVKMPEQQPEDPLAKARNEKRTRVIVVASLSVGVIIGVLLTVISQTTEAFAEKATRNLCATTPLQRKEW